MMKSELMIEQFTRYADNVDILTKLHSKKSLHGYSNSELNCLDCIGKTNNVNATQISVKLNITRSAVSKILKKLLDKGAIISYKFPENHKEIYYQLTPYGKQVFNDHSARHNLWQKRDMKFFESIDSTVLDYALYFMNTYNGYLELLLSEEESTDI